MSRGLPQGTTDGNVMKGTNAEVSTGGREGTLEGFGEK